MYSKLISLSVAVIPAGFVAVIINNEWEIWSGILVFFINIWGVIEAHVSTLPEVSHTEQEDNFNVVIFNACVLISSEVVLFFHGVEFRHTLFIESKFNIGVAITDKRTTILIVVG